MSMEGQPLWESLPSEKFSHPGRDVASSLLAMKLTAQGPSKLEAGRRHAASFDVVLMPGLGHFVQLEDSYAFNRLLPGGDRVCAEFALDSYFPKCLRISPQISSTR